MKVLCASGLVLGVELNWLLALVSASIFILFYILLEGLNSSYYLEFLREGLDLMRCWCLMKFPLF